MKRLNRVPLLFLLLVGLVVCEAVGEELRDANTVHKDYEGRIREQLEEFIESQYEKFEEEAEELENKVEGGEDSLKENLEKLKIDFVETTHKIKEAVDKFVAEQQGKYPPWFIERLSATNALNFDQVLTELKLQWHYFPQKPISFTLRNPYWPPQRLQGQKWRASLDVLRWYKTYEQNSSVCAIKWAESTREHYFLKTFPSRLEAESQGYIVTHDKGCGACSTLKDLSIYLGTKDLTQPTRNCSRKPFLGMVKKCLVEEIGFTPTCAEAWAYNTGNTKLFCSLACIKDYGLGNVLLNRLSQFPDNLPDGELRPCIECDEVISAAGFKYSAGRTRRNSGIASNIQRDPGEVAEIDHHLYFKD